MARRARSAAALVVAAGIAVAGCSDAERLPLAVGDCFDTDTAGGELRLPIVDCDDPHEHQVMAVVTLPDQAGAARPADDQLSATAIGACLEQFEDAVGAPFVSTGLDVVPLLPSPSSWEAGSREVVCALATVDGSPLERSRVRRPG